jgi:hypothetical protein
MSYSVEKLIEEWLAEKEFEELPGTGKPLDLDEYFSWPEDQRIGLSLLKNSGCVPLEVERLREIKRLSDEIEKCADEAVRVRLNRRLQEEQVELSQNRAVAAPRNSSITRPTDSLSLTLLSKCWSSGPGLSG